ELAAARCRSLSMAQLLSRLTDRLGLLVGGPRDRPQRQRTLRDTIAWSVDLLDADASALLARLAVFAGPRGLQEVWEVFGSPVTSAGDDHADGTGPHAGGAAPAF